MSIGIGVSLGEKMSGAEAVCSEGKLENKDTDNHDLIGIIRAASRMAMGYGCQIHLVRNGFQGMIIGGEFICEKSWNDLPETNQEDDLIGSSECKDFRKRAGRLQACKNLLGLKISNLVCIGGDSSLIMAERFRAEWSLLLNELLDTNQIPEESVRDCATLNVFCYELGSDANLFRFGAQLNSLGQQRSKKAIGPVAILACYDTFGAEMLGKSLSDWPSSSASNDEAYTLEEKRNNVINVYRKTLCEALDPDIFLTNLVVNGILRPEVAQVIMRSPFNLSDVSRNRALFEHMSNRPDWWDILMKHLGDCRYGIKSKMEQDLAKFSNLRCKKTGTKYRH